MCNDKRAVLLVNTKSRRGQEWFELARETLTAKGVELVRSEPVRKPDQLGRLARTAIDEKIPLVIVGGGDGTLSSVSTAFVGSGSTLGVLPLGTGNQFARDLGIKADVEAACEVAVNGKRAMVDLGSAGEDSFLTVATVGLTTYIARELTVETKRRFGRFVYAIALVRALRKSRAFRVTLDIDGVQSCFETLQLVIGNGRFHAGPFPLAPDANITDGQLVVYGVRGTSRMRFLRYALALPGGHQVELPEVASFMASAGRISTDPVMRATVDGECDLRTPFDFSVRRAVLPVMAPLDFEG